MAGPLKHEDLIESIRNASDRLWNILLLAKASFEEDPEDFFSAKHGSILGSAIPCYAELFKNSRCSTRTELEELWKHNYAQQSLREGVEELLTQEEAWDDFLVSVDEAVNRKAASDPSNILLLGSNVNSGKITLRSVDSSNETHLADIPKHKASLLEQFASLGCDVHVVTFGTADGAIRWRNETECRFPVWSDTSRNLYKALGFKRSIFQVWRISTMIFYGSELARGTTLPKPLSDYEDDALQMGGNLIINDKAEIVFIHSSSFPADRPTIDNMLEVLRTTCK